MSMVRRVVPKASSLEEASQILRGNWLLAIEQHHIQYSESSVINDILDIGCSVGVSTKYLADKFPTANVTVSEFLMDVRICFLNTIKSFFSNLDLLRIKVLYMVLMYFVINIFVPGARFVTVFSSCGSA